VIERGFAVSVLFILQLQGSFHDVIKLVKKNLVDCAQFIQNLFLLECFPDAIQLAFGNKNFNN